MTMKTVGVIGAGVGGITAMKELKQAGLEVTGFDRNSSVGGRWALETNAGVYKELCLNGTRRAMEFSDYPWERSDKLPGHEQDYHGFPHCSELRSYLQSYANDFGILPCIHFKTNVQSIDLSEDGKVWTVVTTSSALAQQEQTLRTFHFDALVVCTGQQAKARHQLKDTILKPFTGELLHNKDFGSLHEYKGKRVLVVGSSISGGDISAGLANRGECARVVNSVRRAPYHITKVSPVNGRALPDILFSRFPAWLGRVLPDSITTKGLRAVVQANWPWQLDANSRVGAPSSDIREAAAALSFDYPQMVKEQKIEVAPHIKSCSGKEVTFMDGVAEEFDVIICATGWDTDLSFLPAKLAERVQHTNPFKEFKQLLLYKGTLLPGMANLAFCGIVESFGPHAPMAEMQARYIAATFSGKVARPFDTTLEKGVSKLKAHREASPFNSYDPMPDFCEDLADELSISPGFLTAILNPRKYLFGPLYNCSYRTNPDVDGPELAKSSTERFEYLLAQEKAGRFV